MGWSTGTHLVQPRSQGREKALGTRLHLVFFRRCGRVSTRIPSFFISIVLWLAHFAPHFSEEVGRRSWDHNVLLQTAFNHCIQWLHRGKTGQSILIIAIVSTTANNKPFVDVVHHWSRLLLWAIWVTKPIYILTFSYRPKSSSIMYCKAIYPSDLWLLTNDDCCAKNKVVSTVLAPARSW